MNSLFKEEDFQQAIHIPSDSVLLNGRLYNYTYFINTMIWPIDQNCPDIIYAFEPGTDITQEYKAYDKARRIVYEFNWQHPEEVAKALNTTVEHVIRLSTAEELERYRAYIENKSNTQRYLKFDSMRFDEMVMLEVDIFQLWDKRHLYCDTEEAIELMKSPHVFQDLFLYKMPAMKLKQQPTKRKINMNNEIEIEIQEKGLNAPRITPQLINDKIRSAQYHVFKGTCLTVCCLTLANGFTVLGESACASPENFDREIGERIAFDNAKEKIWMLEGYLLKDKLINGQ